MLKDVIMRDLVAHAPAVPTGMLAMSARRATALARPSCMGMLRQDCLHIRLSDYLEARRHAPGDDRVREVQVDRQVPHPAGSGRCKPEDGAGAQDR